MARAAVYDDYIVERFTPYFDRIAPTAPIPITDVDDAVTEIERVRPGGPGSAPCAAAGDATDAPTLRATSTRCRETALVATGLQPFFHTQTGGVKVNDPASTTLRVVMERRRSRSTSRSPRSRRRSG